MSEQEKKFTVEGLKEFIKNGDIETIESFVNLLPYHTSVS